MKQLSNLALAMDAQVICPEHGTVPLTAAEYHEQLADVLKGWHCPRCSKPAVFDDAHWAEVHFAARRGDFEGD